MRIVGLPWYELPETRTAQDSLWSLLAKHLRSQGVRDVPQLLTRGRPGLSLLTDPRLLLGQCCGYDLIYGFSSCLELVATPRYSAHGCDGASYLSLILVRDDCRAGDLGKLRGGVCAVNGLNSHSGAKAPRRTAEPKRKVLFRG